MLGGAGAKRQTLAMFSNRFCPENLGQSRTNTERRVHWGRSEEICPLFRLSSVRVCPIYGISKMTPQPDWEKWLREAIRLSEDAMTFNCVAPFGAVIVRGGKLIGQGQNIAPSTFDPTAHAEIVAIRDACRRAGNMDLGGSELYSNSEPCPMCLAAVYWAKIDRVYFAIRFAEAAEYGFDDQFLYREMAKPHAERMVPMSRLVDAEALKVFQAWSQRTDKLGIEYRGI